MDKEESKVEAQEVVQEEEAGGELAVVEEVGPSTVEGFIALCKDKSSAGDFDEAVSAAQEALVLARDTSDAEGELSAMCTLSQMQRRSGAASLALETAKEMRTLCHRTKSVSGEAQALVEIANAHLAEHEAKPGLRAATAAARLCTKGVPQEVFLQALLAVAEGALLLLGDYAGAKFTDSRLQKEIDGAAAKALEACREAMRIADEVEDINLHAMALFWSARSLLIFSGKEHEAVEAAGKARYLFQKIEDKQQEGETLLVLAQAYHKVDAKSQWATNAAHDALEIFQDLKNDSAKDRTFELFQDLGIALRVAGGGGQPAAIAAGAAAVADGAAPAAGASAVVEAKPKGLDPEMVMEAVQEMAKAAIGLDEAVYADSPLMDSGMDSLTAVSFRNGLQQNLGVKLPSSLMFDYPTMRDVASRIVELSLEDE